MQKMNLSVLALALAILTIPASQAFADQPPGWYAGIGVGANFAQNSKAGSQTIQYDPGLNALGHGGYVFDSGFMIDGEVYHSRSNVTAISGSTFHNGDLDNTDLFANLIYDIHTGTMFSPYIGLGAGVAFVGADNIGPLTGGKYINDSTEEFAYQGIAGVAAQLDRNWTLSIDYRYVATADNPKLAITTGGTASTNNASHNAIVGLTYHFGRPVAPVPMQATTPPTPKPTPVAKPAVAPVPQSYMVFFDFNKADLTPEARRILASAASDYKRGGYVRIVVTGHTDTVGSDAYNMKLSDRRAAAVKAELERLGVEGSMVSDNGVGKSGLLVPTDDQVREAQNRRAEIVFDKK
jgi:OOP family OmpA-OmpF porin